MSSEDSTDLDDRVSPNDEINLTRDPAFGNDLVTGPYPYSQSEQDAWRRAAEDAIKQHRHQTRPELIFANLRSKVDQSERGLRIQLDGDDLLIDGDEVDVCIRLGLRGGDMYIREESDSGQ